MKIEEYAFLDKCIADMENAGAIKEAPGIWVCRNSLRQIHRENGPAELLITSNCLWKYFYKNNEMYNEEFFVFPFPAFYLRGLHEFSLDNVIT